MDKSNNELVKYIAELFVKICREGNKIDRVLNEQSIEKINNLANMQKRCNVEEIFSIIRQESVGYDAEDKENYVYIIKIAIEFAHSIMMHKGLNIHSLTFMIAFLSIAQTEFINVTKELNLGYENKIHEQLNLLKTNEITNVDTEVKQLTNEIANLDTEVKQLKNKQKNTTKDYIAILGIFAAIFMAFDSGLKIELEILNQVNDYAKGILIIFIALFTYILLKSFYRFIVYIYSNNHDKFSVKQHTWKYCKQALAKPLNCALVALVVLYCVLVGFIDKQYERRIEPIVKEEISKLQQKEEKGNIIIYNNTSSTQNQDSTIIPKDEHIQQPMKIKANPPKQNMKKQSDNTKQACPPCQN